MQNKYKIILVISLLINAVLLLHISNTNKVNEGKERYLLDLADQRINSAVNRYSNAEDLWEDGSEEELIYELGEVVGLLNEATILTEAAGAYFSPIKWYSNECRLVSDCLVKNGKCEASLHLYNHNKEALNDFWVFMAENSIIELGVDEVRTRWNEEDLLNFGEAEETTLEAWFVKAGTGYSMD